MKIWQRVTLILVLTGIAVAATLFLLVYNKSHPDYERKEPERVISVEALYSAFVVDEVTANTEFIGKVIAVNGQVAEVEQLDDMVIVAFVIEQGVFGGEGVRCTMLEGHHARALDLSRGEKVEIKGLCAGFTGSDVILEHCSFL